MMIQNKNARHHFSGAFNAVDFYCIIFPLRCLVCDKSGKMFVCHRVVPLVNLPVLQFVRTFTVLLDCVTQPSIKIQLPRNFYVHSAFFCVIILDCRPGSATVHARPPTTSRFQNLNVRIIISIGEKHRMQKRWGILLSNRLSFVQFFFLLLFLLYLRIFAHEAVNCTIYSYVDTHKRTGKV